FKDEREKVGLILKGPKPSIGEEKAMFIKKLENALYMSMMLSYAQGLELLRIASREKDYGLDISEVARIWRGGCIIRSAMLNDFMEAFKKDPELPNLLFDDRLSASADLNEGDLRDVVIAATTTGIPVPGFMSVLSYFDAYRSGHLAANLIQAQRDYFGSHTYQRVDEEGVFHTDW
ncbi:MAG TPA: NADP-dependent phosphogluconate dehydrogenase, partial [Bacteroidales bacterium]|nr:NADP-dependent phosphogluconate dehydrogenase [Bacteroidales bacterium]